MNQTSLSVSDVGKSIPLVKNGVTESKEPSDSNESGSFLSTLGAIFSTDEEPDKASSVKLTDSDDTNTEIVDAEGIKTQLSDAASTDLDGSEVNGSEDQIAQSGTVEGQHSVDESTDVVIDQMTSDEISTESGLSDEEVEQKKALKMMNEGNELLGRLDESNQALKQTGGNNLPLADKVEKVAFDTGSLDSLVSDTADQPNQFHASNLVSISGDATESDFITNSDLAEDVQAISSVTEQQQLMALYTAQQAESDGIDADNRQTMPAPLSEKQIKLISDQELAALSESDQLASQLIEQELAKQNQAQPVQDSEQQMLSQMNNSLVWNEKGLSVEASLGKTLSREDIEATLLALNLDDVPLEELSDEELEYLAQLSIATTGAETSKVTTDQVKSHFMAAAAANSLSQQANQTQQSIQSQQSIQLQQAIAQSNAQAASLENGSVAASAQNGFSEQAGASLAGLNSFNPAQVVMANNANSQQQMMKSALTTAGLGEALNPNDKGDNKESGLSQQLSGLAVQQGIQQAQVKGEASQAVQQTPLHLSREAASEKLSDQIQMMMSKNLKNIDIRLDPPELGRMHIRMTMNGDTAAVQFTVANQQARDMVDQAMPRLREMLNQQGIQLSDTSVQQQNSGQQQNQYAENGENNSAEMRGRSTNNEQNIDESINLNVNIKSKDDGISYYA
ncbi:flagellar hook-length control protein FliK [Vibrio sp. TH_r3]|uniref:flagellar hook-length control protein FliK n=1 Tax=Vibrio sp. TH_r3 TaxID=3082084 RepID=UPI00295431EE|nr:flagellar hook-length control protein FliK [Vibrio sp. TH_r3]MDV7103216.1 flagellar hook-length control protein FliK [Vibrio sp. TH_r3]